MLNWLNDCYEFKLGPFAPKAAKEMLLELAKRNQWTLDDACSAHLIEKTGWLSPFYLNLLLDESFKAGRDRLLESNEIDRTMQTIDIDDGYDRLLTMRSRFSHWHRRLKEHLSEPTLTFSLAILRYTAKAESGLSLAQLQSRLSKLEPSPERRVEQLSSCLAYLEEHGYLGQTKDNKVSFLSFLLRDYWKRNHGI